MKLSKLVNEIKTPPVVKRKQKDMFILETDDNSLNDGAVGMTKKFVRFALRELKIKKPIKITLAEDRETYGLKTFAHFIKENSQCVVYSNNRNLADVFRSIAHELVHKKQYDDGKLETPVQDIGGPIEDEANALAGQIIKKFGYRYPQIFN